MQLAENKNKYKYDSLITSMLKNKTNDINIFGMVIDVP